MRHSPPAVAPESRSSSSSSAADAESTESGSTNSGTTDERQSSPDPAESGPTVEPSEDPANSEPETRRGLWAVMGLSGDPAHSAQDAGQIPDHDQIDDDGTDDVAPGELAGPVVEDTAAPLETETNSIGLPVPVVPVLSQARSQHMAQGWLPLCLGALTVPLSALAWYPGMAASLPAAACGFPAIGLAVSAWTQRHAGKNVKVRAATGAGLALIALICGPLWIAPAGNRYRLQQAILPTQQHLAQIGAGLQQHLLEKNAWPVGGTILQRAGQRRGGAGWMTRLLPYIDQAEVYSRIDLELPFDDPANRAALGTVIDTYLAAGGERKPVAGGYAPAHYAGVGGTVFSAAGEQVPAGIFELHRPVRPAELQNGLSQTWIVGELPGGYPPWGDPENWRVVRKGLNRDPSGFGNAAGTGAQLLFADGSVRFFGNQTDVELLRRLSMRGRPE